MLFFSPSVREKLRLRQITEAHVMQCFANRAGKYLVDDREEHRTTPATKWFVASTDYGIVLKVCFVYDPLTKLIEVKTAYPATKVIMDIYAKYAS
jgi:hypothetical protein